jgi:hypothetical protein
MMPQEKAKELVENFYSIHPMVKVGTREQIDNKTQEKRYIKAKQCALIAVDELINAGAPYCDRYEDYYQMLEAEGRSEYWQQVKEKINNL